MQLGHLKKSNECPICSGAMTQVMEFPNFPMTELYEPYNAEDFTPKGFVDQQFLYCEPCSHGKLGSIVPPEALYSKDYRTRTSSSVGASHSIQSFYSFLRSNLDFSNYEVVIDIGGNDCSLLGYFPDKRRIAVDPNAQGDAELIREYVEKADLSQLKREKKLILCSHTLEHLEKPGVLLEKLNKIFCYGDTLAFQFPSLDYLVKDARIDQIHHQHVHYYSLRSTSLTFARYGFEIVKWAFDPSHYGTLQVIVRRGLEELKGSPIYINGIKDAHDHFKAQMWSYGAAVDRLEAPIGFGASLMLPVLHYHADLDSLVCIAEQDETKVGQRWVNFNKPITLPPAVKDRDIAVTAFNTKLAVRKIVNKLTGEGARNVVVPFHAL